MDQFDPLTIAERWLADGRSIAIATVIQTLGIRSSTCWHPSDHRQRWLGLSGQFGAFR
jgi:hypothetical protein